MSAFTSLHGRRMGLGANDELVSNNIQVSRPAVDATITVSAEGATTANVRDIVVTLLDAKGNAIDYVETVEAIVFLDTDQLAFVVTGGSTGIEVDVNGAVLPIVAKKYFLCTTEANGILGLKWTDTGTEAFALGIRLPNGRVVMTAQFANA